MKALLLWMIHFTDARSRLCARPAADSSPPAPSMPWRRWRSTAPGRGLAGAAPYPAVQPLPPAEIHPVRPRAVMEGRNQFNNVEVPLWVFF